MMWFSKSVTQVFYRANGEQGLPPQGSMALIINDQSTLCITDALQMKYPKAFFWLEDRIYREYEDTTNYKNNYILIGITKTDVTYFNFEQYNTEDHQAALRYSRLIEELNKEQAIVSHKRSFYAERLLYIYCAHLLTWAEGHSRACVEVARVWVQEKQEDSCLETIPLREQWHTYLFIRKLFDPLKKRIDEHLRLCKVL